MNAALKKNSKTKGIFQEMSVISPDDLILLKSEYSNDNQFLPYIEKLFIINQHVQKIHDLLKERFLLNVSTFNVNQDDTSLNVIYSFLLDDIGIKDAAKKILLLILTQDFEGHIDELYNKRSHITSVLFAIEFFIEKVKHGKKLPSSSMIRYKIDDLLKSLQDYIGVISSIDQNLYLRIETELSKLYKAFNYIYLKIKQYTDNDDNIDTNNNIKDVILHVILFANEPVILESESTRQKVPSIFSLYTWIVNNVDNIIKIVLSKLTTTTSNKFLEENFAVREKYKNIESSEILTPEEFNIIKEYGGPNWKQQIYYIENELLRHSFRGRKNLLFEFLNAIGMDFKNFYIQYIKKDFTGFQSLLDNLHLYNAYNGKLQYISRFAESLPVNIGQINKRLALIIKVFLAFHNNINASDSNIHAMINKLDDATLHKFKYQTFVDFYFLKDKIVMIRNVVIDIKYNPKLSYLFDVERIKLELEKFSHITEENLDISKGSDHYHTIKYLHSVLGLININEVFEELDNKGLEIEKKDKVLFELDAEITYKDKKFNFKVLRDKDPLHFLIGAETQCCQKLNGAGEDAAIDSFINKEAGVLVLYYNDTIISQSYFHYIPKQQGLILDNVEENSRNRKDVGLTSENLSEIYAYYAKLIAEKLNLSYVKCGMKHNKIKDSLFEKDSMEKDPRRFMYDKYSDFRTKEHLNLLKYKGKIEYDKLEHDIYKEKIPKFKVPKKVYPRFRKSLLQYLLLKLGN